ncbi:MAG: hypothetical protein KDA61_19900, partial [Planctomycetales bacterium]|nr:hypothetical protein [Planctomycetales bacterium]
MQRGSEGLPNAKRFARAVVAFGLAILVAGGALRVEAKESGDKEKDGKRDKAVAVDRDEDASSSTDKGDGQKDSTDEKSKASKPVVSEGEVTIDGAKLTYTATAGKLPLTNDAGEEKAHVFYVAYAKKGGDASRPITFCFNGGPGSSSVWLHLGMLGPKRVKLDSDAGRIQPPAQIIENSYSLLDKTDLVFIDPVSTGYSRPAKGEAKSQFHGFDEDVRSVAQFIHDYATQNGRWGSPKFL